MAKKKDFDQSMIDSINNYANQIKTMESFVEAARQNQGMLIGAKDNQALINMIREVFQNSIDELIKTTSPCDEVWLIYDERNMCTTIIDNGRGIPFDNIIRIFTSEYTSSNYNKGSGEYSSGTHGIGSKVVCALSSIYTVESNILGETRYIEFHDGKPWKNGEKKIKNTDLYQGTKISFIPYPGIGVVDLKCEPVLNLLMLILPLTPIGSKLNFKGIDVNGNIKYDEHFINEDGILSNLIMKTSSPLIKPIMISADNGTMKADIALTYDVDSLVDGDDITSFSNLSPTRGGTHLDGFIDGLCKFFRTYMNKIYLSNTKSKITVVNSDIRAGLKGIINAAHLNASWQSQSKDFLINTEMVQFISNLMMSGLDDWAKKNPKDLEKLCKYFKDVAEVRIKGEETKIKLSNNYKKNILTSMPVGFIKATGNKDLELLIVEGKSALSSVKNSRDVKTQAIYPIRGKIINALGTKKETFLQNQEVAAIITIIGAGYGKSFDITKTKYKKVTFLTDADADGAHIATLLLRLFVLYMRPMIEDGRVYKAVPPLFGIKKGKDMQYFNDKLAYVKYTQKLFTKANTVEKLTPMQLLDTIYNNMDYTYELEVVSNRYAVPPLLLEQVLVSTINNEDIKVLFKKLKKMYKYLELEKVNGINVITGVADKQIRTLFLNAQLLNECKTIMSYLSKYGHSYILNKQSVSLYQLMKCYENTLPSNVQRYKGLGEMQPYQLRDSTLGDNRLLVQYNINNIDNELNEMRYLETNKADLLANATFKRSEIL